MINLEERNLKGGLVLAIKRTEQFDTLTTTMQFLLNQELKIAALAAFAYLKSQIDGFTDAQV